MYFFSMVIGSPDMIELNVDVSLKNADGCSVARSSVFPSMIGSPNFVAISRWLTDAQRLEPSMICNP